MLKGTVKVTLFDKDGNVVQSEESTNLVTNATSMIMNAVAGGGRYTTGTGNDAMKNIMPIAEKALGGLLLFNNSFTEQQLVETNILVPTDNVIIGCADRTMDATNKRRGSFVGDSGRVTNGYKSIWDFGLTQAQGTISALALTSLECGGSPFNCIYGQQLKELPSGKLYDENNTEYLYSSMHLVKYDSSTQRLYFYYDRTSGTSERNFNLCYTRIPFKNYEVDDAFDELGKVVDTGTVISVTGNTTANKGKVDVAGGKSYIYAGYTSNTLTLYEIAHNSMGTARQITVNLNPTGSTGYSDNYVISGGWLYTIKNTIVKKIDLSTPNQDTTNAYGNTYREYDSTPTSSTEWTSAWTTTNNMLCAKENGIVYVVAKNLNVANGWQLSTGNTNTMKYIQGSLSFGNYIGQSFETDLLVFRHTSKMMLL